MKIRKLIAGIVLAAVVPLTACSTANDEASTSSSTSSSSADSAESAESTDSSDSSADADGPPAGGGPGGAGPGGEVDVSSVDTEEELVALVQDAYGDGNLDLHRGHQPVQDVLDEVLGISHEELHVYMEEQDMNLAAVCEELGIDPDTLIQAMVDAWSPAIDNAVEAGAITEEEADAYLDALIDAFTFRVTWDGVEEMPTITALDA